MKKLFRTFVACLAMISVATLTSCGGSKVESLEGMTFHGATVSGDRSDLISVADEDYKLEKSYVGYMITIKVKLNETIGKKLENIFDGWELVFKDADGNKVAEFMIDGNMRTDLLGPSHDLKEFLEKGAEGDTKEVTFTSGVMSQEDLEKFATAETLELAHVHFNFDDNASDSDSEGTDADDSEEETSSESGSEDFQAMLDSYEEYVDEYIALMKKAKAGDMSAMNDYASFMEKAEALSDKLEKCKDGATAADLARLNKIQTKFLNAMQ